MNVLQVNDLNISFGEFTAVKNLSFGLTKGSTTAIVGESGSGKSLTALSFLSLLPRNAVVTGHVFFTSGKEKFDLLNLPAKQIQKVRGSRISMIFQEPMTSLNPLMRCGRQVAEALQLHKKISASRAKKETIEWFRKTELPDPEVIFNKYPHQLSGGQKQRVMIAMAMCCEPEIIIADEPTTALDVTVQKNILDLLRKLSLDKEITIILITHDLGIVWDYASDILVMNKGEIVERGKVKEILSVPKNDYTIQLIKSRPSILPRQKPLIIPQDNTLLELRDISVRYNQPGATKQKTFTAVNKVSLKVNKGELVGIVGESGSGKSSLGKAALGLIDSTGDILVNGRLVKTAEGRRGLKTRRELQIIFQDPYGSLNPRLPVDAAIEEVVNVHFPGIQKKFVKERINNLFELVLLDPATSNRFPHEFSGGQRQRICIARALAAEPSFLVFDESVSALDVTIQAQVLKLINKLRSEINFSGLFISHDLSVVHYLCDRILVMRKGEIIEEGSAEQVYNKPKHPYTQELINAIPGKGMDIARN